MFRTRERGMSYWPFVVTLIALLAMTYMWYEAGKNHDSQSQRIQTLSTEKQALDQKWRGLDAQLQELVDVTGYPKGDGKPDKEAMAAGLNDALTQMREQLVLKFDTSKFAETGEGGKMEEIGQGEFEVRYLTPADQLPATPTVENLWPIAISAMKRMLADVNHHVQLKSAAESGKDEAITEHKNALDDRDTQLSDYQTQLKAEQARAAEQAQELRDQIATLESQLETSRSERDEARAQAETEVAALQNQIAQLEGERNALTARKVPVLTEGHDGEVLSSGPGMVIINRGKADMLMPGTVFSVFKRVKGGGEVQIGTVKATVVDDNTSRCAVLEATDVMSEGDMISSQTYSPTEQLHFFLLGDFQKMGRSSVARRLEQLGAIVDDEVSPMTHYVVLGSPGPGGDALETTEAFQRAKTYGIEMISEKQLASFTQY